MAPPRAVIDAVQDRLGPLASEPVALGGGITNHNFRARFGDHDAVLRIAGAETELLGIDRAAEQVATQAAAKLGLAPEVLAFLPASTGRRSRAPCGRSTSTPRRCRRRSPSRGSRASTWRWPASVGPRRRLPRGRPPPSPSASPRRWAAIPSTPSSLATTTC
jgi:hypothetical protein